MSTPGTSTKHPGVSQLHPSVSGMAAPCRVPALVGHVAPLAWQSQGRGGLGTYHPPWVMLRWELGEQGPNLLCLCQEIAGTGKRLNLKKKKKFYFKIFLFFCCFYLYFKKSGVKVQKKSVAEWQRFRNHSAELTQAIDTEHKPNTPTTRRGQRPFTAFGFVLLLINFCFPLYKTHQSMPRSGKKEIPDGEETGDLYSRGWEGWLPLSPPSPPLLTSGCSADS